MNYLTFFFWIGKKECKKWLPWEEKAFQTLLFWCYYGSKDKTEYPSQCSGLCLLPLQQRECARLQELLKNPGSGHAPFLAAALSYWGIQEVSIKLLQPQRTISTAERKNNLIAKKAMLVYPQIFGCRSIECIFCIILLDLVTPTLFPPLLGILGAISCGNLKANIEWWPWIWEVMERQMLLLTKKITS